MVFLPGNTEFQLFDGLHHVRAPPARWRFPAGVGLSREKQGGELDDQHPQQGAPPER
jgi:hypothetical protein